MKTLVLSMISIAATIAAMTACTSESDPVDEIDPIVNAKTPIEFSSSILGVQTRATVDGNNFANGNTIGVYGYTKEAPSTQYTTNMFLTNETFTFDGESFKATEAYWERGEKHYFYAYHPLASTTATPTGYQLTDATASTEPLVKVLCKPNDGISEDLLWAAPASNTEGFTFTGVSASNISLPFSHKLSQVKFIVKLQDNSVPSSTLTKLSFDVDKSEGSLNIITGVLTETNGNVSFSKTFTNGTITSIGIDAGTSMIFPGSTISNLKVTINGDELPVTLTTSPALVAGKITTITITVKPYDITMNSSIDPWSEGGTNGAGEV